MAIELEIPVSHDVNEAVSVDADLGVVVAYGALIKPDLLAQLHFVNLHYSLLPRWRGAAPIERAIMAGDSETGVCLMALEAGLDTGPVYRRTVVPISEVTTAHELAASLTDVAVPLLVDALSEGLGEPTVQEGEPTYASKLTNEEFEIDWTYSADVVNRLVRVGRAFTFRDGRRFKIHSASAVHGFAGVPGALDGSTVGCGEGGLRLLEVQDEGKPRIHAEAWLNGVQGQTIRFGS